MYLSPVKKEPEPKIESTREKHARWLGADAVPIGEEPFGPREVLEAKLRALAVDRRALNAAVIVAEARSNRDGFKLADDLFGVLVEVEREILQTLDDWESL